MFLVYCYDCVLFFCDVVVFDHFTCPPRCLFVRWFLFIVMRVCMSLCRVCCLGGVLSVFVELSVVLAVLDCLVC